MLQVPKRHIPFSGTPNFRDFGGYETVDGRTVKWRRLFRSGHMADFSDDDIRQFEELGIGLIFDFRREVEVEVDANKLPAAKPPQVIHLPIDPGSLARSVTQANTSENTSDHFAKLMCEANKEFVLAQGARFKEMFAHLLDHDDSGSLVHCSIGKDRTGFAAAMTLSALGVPKETVMADYMLTGNYLNIDKQIKHIKKKYNWGGDEIALRPVLEVREGYLQSAFTTIEENFVSLEHYLEEVLGVGSAEKEELKGRYLERN